MKEYNVLSNEKEKLELHNINELKIYLFDAIDCLFDNCKNVISVKESKIEILINKLYL